MPFPCRAPSPFAERPNSVSYCPQPDIEQLAAAFLHDQAGTKWLDLTTPIGRGILAFLSALAEDERPRILARANGGRAAARKRGVEFGPKPKLAPHQRREAIRMVQAGQSLRAVAHHYHVGHSTIVRALDRARARKDA